MRPPYLKATIVLHGVQPFSINSFYSGNGKFKTRAAYEWCNTVFMQMAQPANQESLKALREAFNPKLHAIRAVLVAYYPREQYFTKQGTISARTIDCTNWEKVLIDPLILEKFHDMPVPSGAPNMCTDDRYIIELLSSKRPTDGQPFITAEIEILDIPKI